jgi:hypothetical protein
LTATPRRKKDFVEILNNVEAGFCANICISQSFSVEGDEEKNACVKMWSVAGGKWRQVDEMFQDAVLPHIARRTAK